jgi:hypothetical protein
MDVVIPLGTGSNWDNTELRYALRSLEMYCTNLGNVYLVGECPDWIKKGSLVHIPAAERTGREYKEANIMNKILLACNRESLSQKFLFLNDDHYLLSRIPPMYSYYQDHLQRSVFSRTAQDSYYHSLCNTLKALDDRRKPTLNFDMHAPIVYDKTKFVKVMGQYDWTVHYGYVIKSLYCNTLEIPGKLCRDLKITERRQCKEIEGLIAGRKFFSIGDGAAGVEMRTFLQYLYKDKSKFEI